MRLLAPRRHNVSHRRIKRDDSDRILLTKQEIRQSRCNGARIVELGDLSRTELHRLTGIDEQRRTEIRLLFKELDVILVGLRPDLPIDVAGLVASDVFAMLQELDAVAEVRAAVHARQKAFDNLSSPNFEPRDSGKLVRPQRALTLRRCAGIADHASVRLPLRVFPGSDARPRDRVSRRRFRP